MPRRLFLTRWQIRRHLLRSKQPDVDAAALAVTKVLAAVDSWKILVVAAVVAAVLVLVVVHVAGIATADAVTATRKFLMAVLYW